MKRVLVLGATGNIGQGATSALLAAGHTVIGVSRGGEKADAMRERFAGTPFRMLQGSVADEESAASLKSAISREVEAIDAVVANLNTSPEHRGTVLDWDANALRRTFDDNLFTHFIAAKTFIPRLTDGGVYIGLGGGMADRLMRGHGYNAMYQSALRTMFRYIDLEFKERDIAIRELVIAALIATESRPDPGNTPFPWIADTQVGEHLRRMIETPAAFPGPIQLLNSAQGVGKSLSIDFPSPTTSSP